MPVHNAAHEKLVVDLLIHLNSLELGRFWKNPRGVAMTKAGRVVTFGVPGQADISGLLIGGYRSEIEAKTGSGKLEPDQIKFQEMILNWGGFYHEARDVVSTEKAIRDYLHNKNQVPNFR